MVSFSPRSGLHQGFGAALAVALSLAPVAPAVGQQPQQPQPQPQPQQGAKATAAPAQPQAAAAGDVDPKAVAALKRMSTFLSGLNSFELRTDTTLDLVTVKGQRLQLGGNAHYKVRKPNAFQIDLTTDYTQRRFFYDGKQFTIFSPKTRFYATAAAPATIRETLEVLEDRHDIVVPLEDLFRWNDPQDDEDEVVTAAFLVGQVVVDGVATDHYAFRQRDRDWEIWIQQGAQPLPRKVAIVDRTDEARPTYVAHLNWTLNPTLGADVFAFRPPPDAKAIRLAVASP